MNFSPTYTNPVKVEFYPLQTNCFRHSLLLRASEKDASRGCGEDVVNQSSRVHSISSVASKVPLPDSEVAKNLSGGLLTPKSTFLTRLQHTLCEALF